MSEPWNLSMKTKNYHFWNSLKKIVLFRIIFIVVLIIPIVVVVVALASLLEITLWLVRGFMPLRSLFWICGGPFQKGRFTLCGSLIIVPASNFLNCLCTLTVLDICSRNSKEILNWLSTEELRLLLLDCFFLCFFLYLFLFLPSSLLELDKLLLDKAD